MSDVLGKMQKYSALCPRAFHVWVKGHIQRDRKAVVPPQSLRKSGEKASVSETEFSIQQD